jgi:hypothetical protein
VGVDEVAEFPDGAVDAVGLLGAEVGGAEEVSVGAGRAEGAEEETFGFAAS